MNERKDERSTGVINYYYYKRNNILRIDRKCILKVPDPPPYCTEVQEDRGGRKSWM